MRYFDVNNARVANENTGTMLFAIKELLVSAGMTVVGSGDGKSLHEWAGETAGAGTGSGGAHDVWTAAPQTTTDNTDTTGYATNQFAWCVLEDGAGRQALLCRGNFGSFYFGIGVARAGSGGFVYQAGTTDHNTIPAAPAGGSSHERWFWSTRSSVSGYISSYSTTGYYHVWADDALDGESGMCWGFCEIRGAADYGDLLAVEPCSSPPDPADPDPCVYMRRVGGGADPRYAYRLDGSTWATCDDYSSAYWEFSPGGSIATKECLFVAPPVCGDTDPKGTPHPSACRYGPVSRSWGRYGEDQNGAGWCAYHGRLWIPWPDDVTVPLP